MKNYIINAENGFSGIYNYFTDSYSVQISDIPSEERIARIQPLFAILYPQLDSAKKELKQFDHTSLAYAFTLNENSWALKITVAYPKNDDLRVESLINEINENIKDELSATAEQNGFVLEEAIEQTTNSDTIEREYAIFGAILGAIMGIALVLICVVLKDNICQRIGKNEKTT
jgi:uncharacterized membrane protein